jgi:hypothetical protein
MREASANESLMTHRKLFDGNQNRGAPLPWEKQPEARSEVECSHSIQLLYCEFIEGRFLRRGPRRIPEPQTV